jgi:hypothetical protein
MIKKLLAGLSLAGLVMGSIVAPVQAEERPIGAITCDDVALAKQFSQLSDTCKISQTSAGKYHELRHLNLTNIGG